MYVLLVQVFAIDCSNAEFCESCVCVCVCVRERERERERERVTSQWSVQPVRNRLNRGLFANTYELHHCLSRNSVLLSGLN